MVIIVHFYHVYRTAQALMSPLDRAWKASLLSTKMEGRSICLGLFTTQQILCTSQYEALNSGGFVS